MTLGHNTGSAQELTAFIERREQLAADKRAIGDDEKVVNAEIAAAGFHLKTVNSIVRLRKAKPHDVQEAEALLDTYRHALGMATESPLQRFMSVASVNPAVLDSVIAYMEPAVPPTGGGAYRRHGRQADLSADARSGRRRASRGSGRHAEAHKARQGGQAIRRAAA